MILANSKFPTISSRLNSFKISFFFEKFKLFYCVIHGNNEKYFTLRPQNTFLEDMRLLTLQITETEINSVLETDSDEAFIINLKKKITFIPLIQKIKLMNGFKFYVIEKKII